MRDVYIPVNAVPSLPRSSGTVQYALNLARHLHELGHHVTLIATGGESVWGDLEVISVAPGPIREIAFSRRLLRVARTLSPGDRKVIIANGEHYGYPFLSANRSWKVILVAHGPFAFHLGERNRFIGWFARTVVEPRVLSRSRAVVAIDEESMNYYSTRYPATRSIQLGVGVDESIFSPGSKSDARSAIGVPLTGDFVLIASRAAPEKNLPLAARTFLLLAQKNRTVHLILVGSTAEQAFPSELRRRFPMEKLHVLGVLEHSSMAKVFQASNVLLITSREEQFPTVALEALACGIPVVATGVGDLPALLVDGLVGECVPADYNDLAEAIFRVLDQTRNYPSAVETACRQVALSHAWSNVAESISVLVESV